MSRLTRPTALAIIARFEQGGWELYAFKGKIFWRAPEREVTEHRLYVLKVAKKDLLRVLPKVPGYLRAEVRSLFAARGVEQAP